MAAMTKFSAVILTLFRGKAATLYVPKVKGMPAYVSCARHKFFICHYTR